MLSSPKSCNNPPKQFSPRLKNAQPMGKIAPGTFKFILSPNFSENKIEPTTSLGV